MSATSEAYSSRLFVALKTLEARLGRDVTRGEFGNLVGQRVGRTYNPTSAGRWFQGATPAVPVIAAQAAVCGVDPGWLAFGEASAAPPPASPAGQGVTLPPPGAGAARQGTDGQ